MGLSSNSDSKEKVVSTISEIVKISDDWVKYLKKKQDADMKADALILGLVAGLLEMICALIFIGYIPFTYRVILILIVPVFLIKFLFFLQSFYMIKRLRGNI